MTDLKINPIFREIICNFGDQMFSAMYFGRHCGKNILILKHDITVMLVFGEDNQWSNPEFIRPVHIKENSVKGIQIVGNDDTVLMMDKSGSLWKLINAFDFSPKKYKFLHSLNDNYFYEWVSFKEFNFVKVLALTAFGHGFACLGVRQSLKKQLLVLPSMNSILEDYTFEELNATDSLGYYLVNLNINVSNSILKNKLDPTEVLLVSDRLSGRTYLSSKNAKWRLINQSNIFLISALHFLQEKCLALCFENGKLVFYFYNESHPYRVVHLPRKLVSVEKCCCFNSCLLWSDGIHLNHTKLSFAPDQSLVKVHHLKLRCAVESPLSLLRINHCAITVTANNIYYLISGGQSPGIKIKKQSKEILSQISKISADVDKIELKTDMFSHYLYCKDIMKKNAEKQKVEMRCEGNLLVIKSYLGVCLRQKFWKVRLKASEMDKEFVHTVNLECDVSEGMFITIENPFKNKGKVKVSLIGNFDGRGLFLDLGTFGESESSFEKDNLGKQLKKIFRKRNPFYVK